MKIKIWFSFIVIVILGLNQLSAQQLVNFVTYGAKGDPKEGDNDSRQTFFIKLQEDAPDSLVLEIFDADCGGLNDVSFRQAFNSEFKFSLYGGDGAFTARTIGPSTPVNTDIYEGVLIKELKIAEDFGYDDKYVKFAILDKIKGEYFEGAYYFKLLVEGASGDDANVYNLRVQNSNSGNVEIFNYVPTVHLAPKSSPIQLSFNSGNNQKLYAKNFDGDQAGIFFVSPYREPIALNSSDDGEWRTDVISLKPFEKNELCAIQFGPGRSKVNDAVFWVDDEYRNPIPFVLPITTAVSNNRPVIKYKIEHTKDCNKVILDASESYDTDKGKVSVKWVTPDGSIITNLKEEIVFPNPGKYPIILAVKDESNAVESGSYINFNVSINHTPKAIAGEDILRAPNDNIIFSGEKSTDEDGYIKFYDWDFGDGNSVSGKTVNHQYTESGFYKVKLKVTDNHEGNCNTDVDSFNVWINAKPIANAGRDINCAVNEVITFNGGNSEDPDGNITYYQWYFGDGNKDEGKRVLHSFDRPGRYTVSLKVTDNSAVRNNTDSDQIIVWVNNPPKAKAGKDIDIAIDEIFTFDAGSSIDADGEIIEYIWSSDNQFSDSAKISKQSFSKPGKYKVKLSIRDNSGTKTDFDEDVITVTVNDPPIPITGDDKYQTNAEVSFDASQSKDNDGIISKYYWDFGDGTSSSKKFTKHYYKNPGEYKVVLTVQDNSPAKNNTAYDTMIVKINSKPIADAGSDIVVSPNEEFNLSANNSMDEDGSIAKTKWFINDELLSTNSEIKHMITKPGYYTIKLKVEDNSGHDEAIDYDNIIVKVNSAPVIKTKLYYKIVEGETINFDASESFDSDGSIESFEWSVNNKIISSNNRASKTFDKAGVYQVEVKLKDDSQVENSTTKSVINIFVNGSPTLQPIDDILTCSNSIVLSAQGISDPNGDPLSYHWDLGDGNSKFGNNVEYNYAKPGSYPIILKVDDGHGLSNSVATTQFKVKINSLPVARLNEDEIICTGDIITLDASNSYDPDGDLLKYEWDLGDSTTANGISITKNYNVPGIYTVMLKVYDNTGLECNSSIDTKVLTVVESPVAFAGADILGCANKEVFFDASRSTDSDGIVNSFSWNFGDGTTGGGVTTSHVYKKAGTYNVILTITGELVGECDNTDTDELIVTIEEAPFAEFSYKDSIAVNEDISFDASLSEGKGNKIVSYNWNFGDGATDDGKVVKHKFTKSGNYIVELAIDSDSKSECKSSSVKKSIYVNDAPVAIVGDNLTGNINDIFTFDASKSYDPNGKITKYYWDLGDGTTKEGININHGYSKYDNYQVTLRVEDETKLSNNYAIDKINVLVNAKPTGELVIPEYTFVGVPTVVKGINLNDPDGEIESIVWEINDKELSTTKKFEYNFGEAGDYNIILSITDDQKAVTQISKLIKVYPVPQIFIDVPLVVCADKLLKLKANYFLENSSLGLFTEWKLPDGKTFNGSTINTKFTSSGTKNIIVELVDPKKSSNPISQKQFELVVNQMPVAKFGMKGEAYIGGANDNLIFDASASFDPDNDPLTYHWDFGDGNVTEGIKVVHNYLRPGNYKVKLTVKDNRYCDCSEATDVKIIRIEKRK